MNQHTTKPADNAHDTETVAGNDSRQRFLIDNSPVRGDVVKLELTLHAILRQQHYPAALQKLLGEMLVAAALFMSTLKVKGRLSLQLQGTGGFRWAMAECTDGGELRALAGWDSDFEFKGERATDALMQLESPTIFVNIEPDQGERYQGIVGRQGDTLAACLAGYFQQSAQLPTLLELACDGHKAAGILVQLLPRSNTIEEDVVDFDLWPRLQHLTATIKADELLELPAHEILHRLYHEEPVRVLEETPLKFGCTCSRARCEAALQQIGVDAVREILTEDDEIKMDCQFCQTQYRFGPEEALALFGLHVS